MRTRWMCTFALLVVATGAVPAAHAQDAPAPAPSATKLELSLGTVKDKLEGAAVRALVKYGDGLTADDLITRAKEPVFYAITRKVDFDVTDKGTFAGVALRYGVKAIKAPLIPLEGEPDTLVTDSRGWMHVFPLTLGLDADRTFKNRDVLFEAAYVPFKGSPAVSCFKLGGNPVVGLVGQVGHRTRDPSLNDTQSSLRRVKVELAMDMLLSSCLPSLRSSGDARANESSVLGLLARDIGQWRVMIEGNYWHDFALHDTFHRAVLTVRVPTGKGMFMDFKREVGAVAPTFEKGSQFGAYLTVQF